MEDENGKLLHQQYAVVDGKLAVEVEVVKLFRLGVARQDGHEQDQVGFFGSQAVLFHPDAAILPDLEAHGRQQKHQRDAQNTSAMDPF